MAESLQLCCVRVTALTGSASRGQNLDPANLKTIRGNQSPALTLNTQTIHVDCNLSGSHNQIMMVCSNYKTNFFAYQGKKGCFEHQAKVSGTNTWQFAAFLIKRQL